MSNASQTEFQRLHDWWQSVAVRQPQVADFLCPITGRIMEDPVCAEDWFNYERSAIEGWFERNAGAIISPQTKKPMGKELASNAKLKEAIQSFKRAGTSGLPVQISWDPRGNQDPEAQRSVTIEPSAAAARGEAETGEPTAKRARRELELDSGVEAGEPTGELPAPPPVSMSEAMSKFFRELDPLRELLCSVLDNWAPPKIVVLGDESAGKSTLLEQLAMLPLFPRGKEICTRMAIHARLRREPTCEATLAVYSVGGPGQEQLQGEVKRLPQGNGWLWVQDTMERLVMEHASEASGIVKDKILVLQVKRPDVPSIDLVDLPGLTADKKKVEQVQAILQRQLDDDKAGSQSLYLAVVPASGDVRPNTSKAMEFVMDNKLERKTIGVFTKCDQNCDAQKLCALVTGKASGGAVSLDKGWSATMLKPPEGEEFSTHNYERLLIQQNKDAEFFAKPEYQPMVQHGKGGMKGLVQHLEREYSAYLNTTWKIGAMKKVLQKLGEREFERSMLGVVTKASDRDRLARQEVERRLGPDSLPVQELYKSFYTLVLQQKLCAQVRGSLGSLAQWDGCHTREQLETLKARVDAVVSRVVQQIKPFWTERLRGILLAESKVDAGDIVTECGHGVRMRRWGTSKPQRVMQRALKEQPLIQLSHYPEFTTEIMVKCESLLDSTIESLFQKVRGLTQRLVDPDYPYLELRHSLAYPGATAGDSEVKKVKPVCDVQKFLNALVSHFQHELPSPGKLKALHEGVSVGAGQGAALESDQRLSEEIARIEAARDGIRRALVVSDEDIRQLSLEEEHCLCSVQ